MTSTKRETTEPTSQQWRTQLTAVLDDWASHTPRHIIISPDVDGFASAALITQAYDGAEVIGFYTTTHLVLWNEHTKDEARDALWLDHDISVQGIRCVGQHIVHHKTTDTLPLREPMSWNPNVWHGQAWENSFKGKSNTGTDKYPYATTHFLYDLLRAPDTLPTKKEAVVLAHADGTWFALDCYTVNARAWQRIMFPDSVWLPPLLTYRSTKSLHTLHTKFTVLLDGLGFRSASRSGKQLTLSEDLQALVGFQSLTIRVTTDPQRYSLALTEGMRLVYSWMGTDPALVPTVTRSTLISGERRTEYPDRLADMDTLMTVSTVFSHAFTAYNTLSYTVGMPF